MFLFVGLGNPTSKYKNTRHNIGFMAVDKLIDSLKPSPVTKSQFFGDVYKKGEILLLKPLTFMNESGKSVRAVHDFYKPKEVVVIHDDVAIPFGSVRIKRGGGSGGHNGLKSLDAHFGNDYIRIRLGIGEPKNDADLVSFVLGNFLEEEFFCVERLTKNAAKIALELTRKDLSQVIAENVSKKSICEEAQQP